MTSGSTAAAFTATFTASAFARSSFKGGGWRSRRRAPRDYGGILLIEGLLWMWRWMEKERMS